MLGETERCNEKREKVGGALRYALIGALEVAKSAREGGSHRVKKEGARQIGESPEGFSKSFFKVFEVIFGV